MRKGQRYITCVIDHDTGRLVWAAEGRNMATLQKFFDALGEERSALLTHVSCDGAEWIHTVVTQRAKRAKICLDAFHVMAWATKALDEVRREMWRELKRSGNTELAESMKGARWALLKSPFHQSPDQKAVIETIAEMNQPLFTGYLLKEQLRIAIATKKRQGRRLVLGWIGWAKESGLAPFVKLARTIEKFLPSIYNMLNTGLTNARTEATNTHLRVLTRRSYGFHSPEALIAMAMLTRGGMCPSLPGRAA